MKEAPDPALARAFHRAMIQLYEDAKRDTGYVATRFIQMIAERGGVETARHLLNSPEVSDGFTALWERGRLDLSVEHHVLRPEFRDLFTPEERQTATERLSRHGFRPA